MFINSLNKRLSKINDILTSERRLLTQLRDINNNEEDNSYYSGNKFDKVDYNKWSVTLLENNLYNWRLCIKGEANTIYENGTFFLDIRFPKDYPFKVMFQNCLFLLNSLV